MRQSTRPAAPVAASLPLFYSRPRILQPALHGRHSLRQDGDYRFAAATNAVPLVAQEMTTACRHYPIVFSDDTTPHPVAVLGLRRHENAFVDAAGQWRQGAYVPAYVRRYPFIFLEDTARAEVTLCVDEAAGAFVEDGGQPLFGAAGEPTALALDALAFCRGYQAQHLLAGEFAQALAHAGLLVDHRADATLADGRRLSLAGFKVIDEHRFERLPADELTRWRDKGWLRLAYSHFVSTGAWAALL